MEMEREMPMPIWVREGGEIEGRVTQTGIHENVDVSIYVILFT